MSVLSYLENSASAMVLSNNEKASIATSINTVGSRLNSHFGSDIKEHFKFGSYTRETILPRKWDEQSDIDYMVIFNNPNNYKSQTLLGKLKKFAEAYYPASEIYRSYPTTVLELAHIKFKLVPAMKDEWGRILIPSPSSSYVDWMETDPTGFNTSLTNANEKNSNQITPLIRLMKNWNVQKANRGYSSFLHEKLLVEKSYFGCNNLKEYFFKCFDDLYYNYDTPQYFKTAIDNAKAVVNKVRESEADGYYIIAENEIKKIIPEI